MAHMTEVSCKCCGKMFEARTADVNRGWGKFCSKRCKAVNQERRTGQNRDYLRSLGKCSECTDRQKSQEDEMHQTALDECSQGWDDHKDWI